MIELCKRKIVVPFPLKIWSHFDDFTPQSTNLRSISSPLSSSEPSGDPLKYISGVIFVNQAETRQSWWGLHIVSWFSSENMSIYSFLSPFQVREKLWTDIHKRYMVSNMEGRITGRWFDIDICIPFHYTLQWITIQNDFWHKITWSIWFVRTICTF